ncbi:MAG: AMP-binding protein [Verrucomicrobiales bacterium]|nr:AMP-binding protein [Verrucomicrobiales bacterium]
MKRNWKDWDQLDAYDVKKAQYRQLRQYLRDHVVPFSAHYRKLFAEHGIEPEDIRTAADFANVPFTSKRDLIAPEGEEPKTRDFVLIPDEEILKKRWSTIRNVILRGKKAVKRRFEHEYRPIMMTSTTGRSSEPVPFLYSKYDIENLELSGRRLMEVCDSNAEFRHMNLFPYAPHLAFWQMHYAGIGFDTFTISTGGGKVMGTDGNVRILGKIKPDALIGMPTFIYHVLQVAAEQGVDAPNIKKIVLGGEKVPEGMKRKLRALCAELGSGSVDVMATYGFTEAKMAFPECPVESGVDSPGYHLFPDLGLFEVIDPDTGIPVNEGEPGEIVWTPLDSRGSVVVRYRTGDHISDGLVHEPCPHCGRTLPRLVGRISRVSDVRRLSIDKIKGTLVNFNDLEHILDDLEGIGTWQIEIRKRNDDPLDCDEIVVHVSPSRRGQREKLEKAIETKFVAATEISPNRVEFHNAETLREKHGVGTALKEEKVIDNRPKSNGDSVSNPTNLTNPTTS